MKDWELLEHTVMLLETSLTPDAQVQRDVKLKDLTSDIGADRQCDIVIWTGTPPRETVTIVEVQDRTRPVDINMFQGWILKMKDVGAQHLICVSRHEFPDSIKEKAGKAGSTIRLMTLKELDNNALPNGSFGLSFTVSYPEFTAIKDIKAQIKSKKYKGRIKFRNNEKFFSLNETVNKVSMTELANSVIRGLEVPKTTNFLLINFPLGNNKLWIEVKGKLLELASLSFILEFMHKEVTIPFTMFSYEQDKSGTLVWMAEANATILERHANLKIPIHQSADGEHYEIRALSLLSTDNMNLTLTKTSNS
ncbi:MAG TPA: hypothetical protein VNW99_11010 [Cytophagaceae bacterium]|jgi:hypothetical protein|nr:hypothetical protein [Cytophagaceae bacterium]